MSLSKSPNHVPSSPPKLLEDGKQERRTVNATPSSIRRTLSADMSQMKRSEEECDKTPEKLDKIDTWGSLIATKQSDSEYDSNFFHPPPYVHPPMKKRSAGALSEKSLEICTESLGSESGSDCFSGYSSSEFGTDDEKEYGNRTVQSIDLHGKKYKKLPAQSFPPPALTAMYMRSRRENGRFVLEAVEVNPRKYFDAKRRDGRLVLSLINSAPGKREIEEERVDDGGGAAAATENYVVVKFLNPASGVMSVSTTKSGLVVKKLIAIGNPNAEEDHRPIQQKSMLPPPRVVRLITPPPPPPMGATATSFNVYEYFWRSKVGGHGPPSTPPKPNNTDNNPQDSDSRQDSLVLNLPYLKGCNYCKQPRRSFLLWGPNCIATT